VVHLSFLEAASPGKKLQIANSKLQRSTKSQTPNTKLQTPEKLQARSAGRGLELGTWDFFGVWSLVFSVFRFRDFSGAWGLVLGVSLGGGSKTEIPPNLPIAFAACSARRALRVNSRTR
jgi:hypothetical protein